ncbi:DUF3987 domain-containing protein [Rhizobium leguminosarum]|uniref:DUF3987 domain-containing protein n=1 Tax=Rhizobium leguminosarum TaxID=384 RepID=UPI001C90E116|nr:DUF3987 domain-containing protein [Rhizobium leguminosarum]MBY3054470.1 DUF3987 domain-containing protein [Rhizobium leguminosarum]
MRRDDDRTLADAEIRRVHGFASSPDSDYWPADEYLPPVEEEILKNRPFSPIEAQERDLRDRAEEREPPSPSTGDEPLPVDIWARASSPPLPEGLLPPVIENFARLMGETMGADPAGLAVSALAACAAAIKDSITIQPKQHDYWTESARLWVGLIGPPSTSKSPVISAAIRPLKQIERRLHEEFRNAKSAFDALDKSEKGNEQEPRFSSLILEDATIEGAQRVLADSPAGVLMVRDELSGWFGAMEKYSGGGKGAAADRGFWLQSFNGGSYKVDRVGRGMVYITNLSVSLIGGIQPEPIKKIANDCQDDGLLQRLLPIVLRRGSIDRDVPIPDVAGRYSETVEHLARLQRPLKGGLEEVSLRFSQPAQIIWEEVVEKQFLLSSSWETVNAKLAAHLGKYKGIFARLCVIWHCIETHGDRPDARISGPTAARVRDFLFDFLYEHAIAFYTDVIGLSERQDEMQSIAGWILTHKPETFTLRDVIKDCRAVRNMDHPTVEAILQRLDAFGWITRIAAYRRDSKIWRVNSRVHDLFRQKAAEEAKRRSEVRSLIRDNAAFHSS